MQETQKVPQEVKIVSFSEFINTNNTYTQQPTYKPQIKQSISQLFAHSLMQINEGGKKS